MKGDFSRDMHNPTRRHFTRVLMQQGRVQLDADWNAQVTSQLRYLRMLANDLIGPHGGPGDGFKIMDKVPPGAQLNNNFSITRGHYYVGGWACENDGDVLYNNQGTARYLPNPDKLEANNGYLVYLDVWERHVTPAETDGSIEVDRRYPDLLRELALGGADTSSRAELVWQVKVTHRLERDAGRIEVDGPTPGRDWAKWAEANVVTVWEDWVNGWKPNRRGSLRVEARKPGDDGANEPCVISPKSQYRGLENQLYRVEIHRPGPAATRGKGVETDATFKWSRENGSVLLPIESISGVKIKLAVWWRDDRLGITEGDWVEVANDVTALSNASNKLRRVKKVDPDELTLTLDDTPSGVSDDAALHPVVRRWDHRRPGAGAVGSTEIATDGALYIVEGEWIELENGIRIWFDPSPDAGVNHKYVTSDYWTIPARTSVGDVLWPKKPGSGSSPQLEPESLPPHGVEHQFAPLAIITVAGTNEVTMERDLRLTFKPLTAP